MQNFIKNNRELLFHNFQKEVIEPIGSLGSVADPESMDTSLVILLSMNIMPVKIILGHIN